MRLPVDFRSLSRPSSASSAKASTIRSFSLDRIFVDFLGSLNLKRLNHYYSCVFIRICELIVFSYYSYSLCLNDLNIDIYSLFDYVVVNVLCRVPD